MPKTATPRSSLVEVPYRYPITGGIVPDRRSSGLNFLANALSKNAANKTYVPTPSEEEAIKYHRRHLDRGTYLRNQNGSLTTFYGAVVGDDNGAMLIPTYWDGRIRDVREAVKLAAKSGIKFPKYKNVQQALAAEKELHKVMEADTIAYQSKYGGQGAKDDA